MASNLERPTSITHAGDGSGRLFVTQQAGKVSILNGTNINPVPFLDISSRVKAYNEQGLLSVAFPPGYVTKRYFYACYNRTNDGAVMVSRFSLTSSNDVASADSEETIIVIPKPFDNANHNGGQLAFGPDGYLYISIGDGGWGGDPLDRAQDLGTLLGKILRIDPENGTPYSIPPTNPFLTNSLARPEIWAYGLRNPWRFSFDRQTGDLYIADVGQMTFEEVNFQPANSPGGENYGWRIKEGTHDHVRPGDFDISSLTSPLAFYDFWGGCIIGGYVYRGPNPALNGIYFFADFAKRKLFGLKRDGNGKMFRDWDWNGNGEMVPLRDTGGVSCLGEDESGNIYFADYFDGQIYRLDDNGVAAPPTFFPLEDMDSNLTFNSLTPNASIRYTLADRDPIASDPVITPGDSIIVTNGMTIRAQTFREDLLPSAVRARTISNLRVATPVLVGERTYISSYDSDLGSYFEIGSNTVITLTSATPNARIFYTFDGQTPSTNSTLYTAPFVVNPGDNDLQTAAFRADLPQSEVYSMTFESELAMVPAPIFTPPSGPITNGTAIKIFSSVPNASIFYTLDSSHPTTNSFPYTGPIPLYEATAIRAIATATNYGPGKVGAGNYEFFPVVLEISPPGGHIMPNTLVSIFSPTPGVTIYYTTNNTVPTTNSTLYTGPFRLTVSAWTSFTAKGYAFGYKDSKPVGVYFEPGDRDSDGIPDAVETAGSGFTSGIDDRLVDSDTDGLSNAGEYIAGTNPLSSLSRFLLGGAIPSNNISNTSVQVWWNATSNRNYQLFSSTDLISWDLVTNVHATTTSISLTLTNAPESSRYYRLNVALP